MQHSFNKIAMNIGSQVVMDILTTKCHQRTALFYHFYVRRLCLQQGAAKLDANR